MALLGLDLIVFVFFAIVVTLSANKTQGFIAIVTPYVIFGTLLFHAPILLTIVNLFALIWIDTSIWFALLPLSIILISMIVSKSKDLHGAYIWNKHIEPQRKKLKAFMNENGYDSLAKISVNPWQKNMYVSLYKEDKERFLFQKEMLNKQMEEKFVHGYFADYYTGIHVHEHESKKNIMYKEEIT